MSNEEIPFTGHPSVIAEYCRLARGPVSVVLTINTENVAYEADASDVVNVRDYPNITPGVSYAIFSGYSVR